MRTDVDAVDVREEIEQDQEWNETNFNLPQDFLSSVLWKVSVKRQSPLCQTGGTTDSSNLFVNTRRVLPGEEHVHVRILDRRCHGVDVVANE